MSAFTNLLLQSANFSTTWGIASLVRTNAASIIPGQTASQFENPGSANQAVQQTVGTLTGSPETVVVVVEEGTATDFRLGVQDATVTQWVVRANFDWSSSWAVNNTDAGSSASSGRVDLGDGRHLLWLTATPSNAGNTRRVLMYPTGTVSNTNTAIIHYAGLHEAASYPSALIPTGATTPEYRVLDLNGYPISARPVERRIPLAHYRRRASGKLGSTLHGNATHRREWSLSTEIMDRADALTLQAELEAPGTFLAVHEPLISHVPFIGAECRAENVRRLDGPLADHARVRWDMVEVRPV